MSQNSDYMSQFYSALNKRKKKKDEDEIIVSSGSQGVAANDDYMSRFNTEMNRLGQEAEYKRRVNTLNQRIIQDHIKTVISPEDGLMPTLGARPIGASSVDVLRHDLAPTKKTNTVSEEEEKEIVAGMNATQKRFHDQAGGFDDTSTPWEDQVAAAIGNVSSDKDYEATDKLLKKLKHKSNDHTLDKTEQIKFLGYYNQLINAKNSDILSKTKMDGTDHSVLEEMQMLANMDGGKEKDKRKEAVFAKMEKLGIPAKDYALYTEDGNFSWETFGGFLGNNVMAGIAAFDKGMSATANLLLGKPLSALGWENNPIAVANDYFEGQYAQYQHNANLRQEQLGGGGGWGFAGDVVEGTVAALPSAILAIMTSGTSLGGSASTMGSTSSSQLATKAAYETGNVLTKAGLTTEAMMNNPQYWLSVGRTLGTDYEEAKAMGASDTVAALGATFTSMVNAGIEIGPDGMSGIQGLPQEVAEGGSSKLLKWAISSAEEGGEEGLQKFVNEAVTKVAYNHDAEILDPMEYAQEMALGTVTGAALGSGQIAVQSGANAVAEHQANKLTDIEQKLYDKVVENRIAQREEAGKKLTAKDKAEIKEQVRRDLERGYISTDTIEEVLGGESYSAYDALLKESEEFNELYEKPTGELSKKQLDRLAELEAKNKENPYEDSLKTARQTVSMDVLGRVKDSRLVESYNEKYRLGQDFQPDYGKFKGAKFEDAAKKTLESAVNAGLNNTNRVHDIVDLAAKISSETGMTFTFKSGDDIKADFIETQTAKIAEIESIPEAQRTAEQIAMLPKLKDTLAKVQSGEITVNGDTVGGDIVLNLDSRMALNRVVGHEVTHNLGEIDQTKEYVALKDAVLAYAKTKGVDIDSKLNDLKLKYDGVTNANPEAELVADLVGEYLFTDQEFVNRLSVEHRNVFQRIYDQIKHLCKIATAGSQEARELEIVKKAFEDAYRASSTTEISAAEVEASDTQYSMSVTDKETIDFLENQEHITTYKAMQVIDGKLYPPMAAKVKDENGKYQLSNPSQLGVWQQATEDPKNIKKFKNGVGYYTLNKGNGKSLDAAYNPYEHSSNLVLNDQFEEAYNRPNIVTVECVIPASEMTSGYKAEHAKDGTGLLDWKSGVVAGKLKDNQRKVYLSRWLKPVRILSDAETASMYKDIVGDVAVPFNVVPPGLLTELEKAGVNIDYEGSPNYKSHQRRKAAKDDAKYSLSDSTGRQLSAEQQEYFKDSVVRDENGNLKVMYHGTSGGGHTVFDTYGSNYGLFGTGSYFTDNKEIAQSYTHKGKGKNPQVYETYLNIKNPIDMDAQADPDEWAKAFEDVDFPESGTNEDFYRAVEEYYADQYMSKWEVAEIIQESIQFGMGYDGITHIGGGRVNPDGVKHRVYIAFEPEQIKNIDNVKPTGDPDIRYSISEDSDGKKLSKAQQDYFKDSKITDANGHLLKVYHGTTNNFTTFRQNRADGWGTGIYFTDNREEAFTYGENVVEAYLNIQNPYNADTMSYYDIGAENTKAYRRFDMEVWKKQYDEYDTYEEYKADGRGADMYDIYTENVEVFNKILRELGYDGIIADGSNGIDGLEIVAFRENQPKLTTNTNPTENADIRYSLSDSDGNQLTKEQADFFKDSKARDMNGNLRVMYHTTNNDFTVFDKGRKGETTGDYNTYLGFFFADTPEYMNQFPEFKDGKTETYYLNMKNPIDMNNISKQAFMDIVEATGGDVQEAAALYDREYAAEIQRAKFRGDNSTIMEMSRLLEELTGDYFDYAEFYNALKPNYEQLMSKGYDGVINSLDGRGWANEYIVLDSNQAKLTSNKNPTADSDIRYSLSEDSQGRQLSDGQKEYFKDSKIVDANGNLRVMYHGSSETFTVFDKKKAKASGYYGKGFYFTDSDSHAKQYGNTYEVYLNITNPLRDGTNDITKDQLRKFVEAVAENDDYGIDNYGYGATIDSVTDSVYGKSDFAMLMDINASCVGDMVAAIELFNEVNGTDYNGIVAPTETVAFYPEQIKSVGNKAPTSNQDIRYSLSEDNWSKIREMQTEVNRLTESIMEFEASEEYKDQMRKITEAVDSGNVDAGVKGYQQWLKDSGYGALTEKRNALRDELDNLRKKTEETQANEAVEAERKAIEKSGLSEADYFRKQAVKEFGYTPYFYDAGYITTNGKMLNFSGEKGEHFGSRGEDHRAIGIIYAETNGTDALNRFVNDGNIRISPESPGIDLSATVEPTKEQYATIKKFAYHYADKGYFSVDISDKDGRVVGSLEYENRIFPTRIISDIQHYFATGEIRQPSGLENFRSLSFADEQVTPINSFDIYGKDMRKVAPEQIAPVTAQTEQNVPNTEVVEPISDSQASVTQEAPQELFPDDLAPIQGELSALIEERTALEEKLLEMVESGNTGEEFNRLSAQWDAVNKRANALEAEMLESESARIDSLNDTDVPPEQEAPYPGEPMQTPDPFADRDMVGVGNRKVKAYMYENPEVKPFFQDAALGMLDDLHSGTRGEKWFNDDVYYESGGEKGWGGTKRTTTEDIADLLDNWHYTYAEIEKGLNDIIEDNGKENNAVSKRIEFMLDYRLRNGYTGVWGEKIPPDQGYIHLLKEKQINEYSDEAFAKFMETADQYAPIAPVAEEVTVTEESTVTPIKEEYEAIRPQPKKQPKMVRVDKAKAEQTANVLVGEPAVNKKKTGLWSLVKEYIFDNGMVFEDLSKKNKNRNIEAKWNFVRYSRGMAQHLMKNGADGVRSLDSIMNEVNSTGKTQKFYEYLYHMHNVDRMTLEGRYDGVPNKAVFGDSVTAEMSRAIATDMAKENPEFRRIAQDIYRFNSHLRQLLVDGGVISQETADLWAEMYPHYVPIRRVDQSDLNINVPLDTRKTGVNAPVKRATGGSSDILDLFDTMGQRTIQTLTAVAKNRFGVELKNALGTTVDSSKASVDEVIDSIDTHEELLQAGKNGMSPTFTVFENGEKVTFEITEEMYEAMKPAGKLLSYTNKPFNVASNIHRGLLTEYNPAFMLTNAIKDAQDVLINSQHPLKTYARFPQAVQELKNKGFWYEEYMANGGEQNSYFDTDTNTFQKENKVLEGVKKWTGLGAISDANNFIERIPRLAEYIASREAGRSIEESMLDAARVTTNFAAGGKLTKVLNRNGFTFLNASMQGAVQQVRNIREAKMNGLRGTLTLAAKFAVAGLVPSLLNHLLWDDDEEYKELSDYVKDNYYIVAKYDDGKFVRIPKGRTVAVIQNAFEQMENAITGNDEVDLKRFGELLVSNLAPNNPLDNNIIAPIGQVISNETWYGEDLVPTRLQDKAAAEQYDETTDAISRWLGEKTSGWHIGDMSLEISPIKANYLLDQYSGGVGDTILPMLTPAAESGDNSFVGNLLAPIKDKFTTDSVLKNQNVSDFYDKVEELSANAKASKATDEDILMSKYMNSVSAAVGELYGKKRIEQNTNLPDSQKYPMVRGIQQDIVDMVKEGLSNYEKVNINGNHATVGDMHFQKNEDGEWQKMTKEQVSKYKATSAAGSAPYANDGYNHYRYYAKDGETEGEWRKLTDDQVEKQNKVTSTLGITPEKYWGNKEEYDFAYEYPESYAVAKAVGGYKSYSAYADDLYDIKADKDANGKSISGSRKDKVIDYINGLDLDTGMKYVLFKNEYNADDTYNIEIIEYINGRNDLSYEEKVTIYKKIGFNVDSDGYITW